MKQNRNFDDIEALIAETEQEGLISAPQGLKAAVLEKAAKQQRKPESKWRYRLRVVGSMAAALWMLAAIDGTAELEAMQKMAEKLDTNAVVISSRMEDISGTICEQMMEVIGFDKPKK